MYRNRSGAFEVKDDVGHEVGCSINDSYPTHGNFTSCSEGAVECWKRCVVDGEMPVTDCACSVWIKESDDLALLPSVLGPALLVTKYEIVIRVTGNPQLTIVNRLFTEVRQGGNVEIVSVFPCEMALDALEVGLIG